MQTVLLCMYEYAVHIAGDIVNVIVCVALAPT